MFPFPPRSLRRNADKPSAAASSMDSLFGDSAASDGARAAAGRGGWHSSSLELMEGLEVTEDVALDALPADWPVFAEAGTAPR